MWGLPVAGRRAFDLKRTVDFVRARDDLRESPIAVVGLNDEALPALLAAASDSRIERLACSGYVTSFISQMIAASLPTREEFIRRWNRSAMDWGRLDGASYRVDLGSVIPSVLEHADIPDLVALVAPRKVLYCGVRDNSEHAARFKAVTSKSGSISLEPETPLSSEKLLRWLAQ